MCFKIKDPWLDQIPFNLLASSLFPDHKAPRKTTIQKKKIQIVFSCTFCICFYCCIRKTDSEKKQIEKYFRKKYFRRTIQNGVHFEVCFFCTVSVVFGCVTNVTTSGIPWGRIDKSLVKIFVVQRKLQGSISTLFMALL